MSRRSKASGISAATATDGASRQPDALTEEVAAEPVGENNTRNLLLVGAGMFVSMIFQLGSDTIITSFAGHLGGDNLAARGVCSTIIGFAFFLFGFLTDGITSRVASALGKGNKIMVGAWIKIALMAGAASGILCGVVFGASYKGWINLFGQSNLDHITTPYYFVRLAGLPFNLLFNAVTGVLQGLQMVWVVLAVNVFLCTIDVITNYLFMFTLGWSIIGGPLGIDVAFLVGLAVGLFFLFRPSARERFQLLPWFKNIPRSELVIFFKDSTSLMFRSLFVELSIFLVPVLLGRYAGKSAFTAYTGVVTELCKYSYYVPGVLGTVGNMLGALYLAQKRYDSYRFLCRLLPAIGLAMGLGFTLTYWLAKDPLVNLFILPDERESINLQLDSIWLVLLFLQPVNSLLGVYEGLTYGSQSFDYIRNVIISGAVLIYTPLMIAGVLKMPDLLGIWLPKVCFDVYRLVLMVGKLYFGILPSLPQGDAHPTDGKESPTPAESDSDERQGLITNGSIQDYSGDAQTRRLTAVV